MRGKSEQNDPGIIPEDDGVNIDADTIVHHHRVDFADSPDAGTDPGL